MLMVHVWLVLTIALPAIQLDRDTVMLEDALLDTLGCELTNALNACLDALYARPPTSALALHAKPEPTLPIMLACFAQLDARHAPAQLSAPLARRDMNSQETAA